MQVEESKPLDDSHLYQNLKQEHNKFLNPKDDVKAKEEARIKSLFKQY